MFKKRFYYSIDDFSDSQIDKLVEHMAVLSCGYWESIAYDKCHEAIYKLKDERIYKRDKVSLKFTLDVGAEVILAVLGALKLPKRSIDEKRITHSGFREV